MGVIDQFDVAHLRRLREVLAIFLELCGQGIRVARGLCQAEHQQFQEMLENGYKKLMEKVLSMVHVQPAIPMLMLTKEVSQ